LYTLSVAYTDYKKVARRKTVSFNLDANEVFKLLPELKSVFDWLESNQNSEPRELLVDEVRDFYTNFEHILLEAYGEMSEDGEYFDHDGKYQFEKSAVFSAAMYMFVIKPEETVKLLEGMMPKELFDLVQKTEAGELSAVAQANDTEKDAEIARLRALVLENGGTSQS
jgi:hypothetical protein